MTNRMLKSVSLVSLLTFLSRILGFARDVLCAHLFGASAGFDAFLVAFKIPNFLRRLFAEGAFSQAFVPVLSDYQQKKSSATVYQFIDRVAGLMLMSTGVLALLVVAAAPWVVRLFAPGFSYGSAQFSAASDMLRLTFFYLPCIAMAALMAGILGCKERFGAAAFAPVILNVCLIGSALFVSPSLPKPVYALAMAVPVAGGLQLLLLASQVATFQPCPTPRLCWADAGVRRVLKLMLGALFGVSVAQISLLFDTFLASFLPEGSISWLYYSDRLANFPLGVFAVALSTVILPYLAKYSAIDQAQKFARGLDWALRTVLLIAVPAAVGLGVASGPLLMTLFQYGHFEVHDALMAQRSLVALSLGIPAFMLVKVLAAGFYARQDIKTPVRIAVKVMITNMVLNLMLIHFLAHAGLALAVSIASWLNALLLLNALPKERRHLFNGQWFGYIGRLLVAGSMMGGLLWTLAPEQTWWWEAPANARLWMLLKLLFLAKFSYFAVLWLTGWRFKDVQRT